MFNVIYLTQYVIIKEAQVKVEKALWKLKSLKCCFAEADMGVVIDETNIINDFVGFRRI